MAKDQSLYVYSKGLVQADCSKTACESTTCYCDIHRGKGLGPATAKKYVKSKKRVPSTFPMKRFTSKLHYHSGEYMDCYGKPCKTSKKHKNKAKCKCTKRKGKYMTVMSKRKKPKKKRSSKKSKKMYINGARVAKSGGVSRLNPSHLFR
jgi:adenylosuccinate synthase